MPPTSATSVVCRRCREELVVVKREHMDVCITCGFPSGPSAPIEGRSTTRDTRHEGNNSRINTEPAERGRRLVTGPSSSSKPPLKALQVDFSTSNASPNPNPSIHASIEPKPSFLDPVPSLTSSRVSSSAYDSLYPGALFEGIQTNKTKEHRVSVRIVDINLQQSTLAGFLTIHDLTDQHPEITTFFDGQIIGDQHGFVTNDWGASETVDMTHWQQFTPYHHIHASELVKPRMTLKHPSIAAERGVLFMRWKERFLVPDHRVRSINGASYAGFYYICVELGSLMGALHGDALERPAPKRGHEEGEGEAEEDEMDEEMSLESNPSGRAGRSRSRRSTSRNTRRSESLRYATGGPSIRIPNHGGPDDDKSAQEYGYGAGGGGGGSPVPSSSTTPTATYPPSTSPVTGANRIRRASGATGSGLGAGSGSLGPNGRRRRLSIYTAGSVQAQMMDHAHPAHVAHARAIGGSWGNPPTGPAPLSHLRAGRERESESHGDGMGDDEIMALEDALALNPITAGERERARERALLRLMDGRRHAVPSMSMSRERYPAETAEGDQGYGHNATGARKGSGWIGGGPARLTGYYYHSERDHCDLYQKLELHHVPERTRRSFEFR